MGHYPTGDYTNNLALTQKIGSFKRPRGTFNWPSGLIRMDNFANASFPPELISVMQNALEDAIATLPHPVNSSHIISLAETILRSAKEGERDSTTLRTMALLELRVSPRKSPRHEDLMTYEEECRQKAEHYRKLARGETDAVVLEILRRMADEWSEKIRSAGDTKG
jgi:hypothetical protein